MFEETGRGGIGVIGGTSQGGSIDIEHGIGVGTGIHIQNQTDEGGVVGGTDEVKAGSNLDLSGGSLVGPDYDNPIFNESVEATTIFPDYGEVREKYLICTEYIM